MSSVAIIVWASDYQNELKALPACARDAAAMQVIIANESRFTETLVLANEASSVVAFDKISKFLKKYERGALDEIFFYFTGHGEATAEDFLFLLPGYKSSAKLSTSLVNSQIDELVRTLNPKLFVKIVDACESGTAYIKDSNPFETLTKGKNTFQNVFFFSSSHSDEKSYLDSHLSYLTECIVKTVYNHPIESVKYVNLLNSAADFFDIISFQRPYVVQQGSLDSVFCNVDPKVKKDLLQYIRVVPAKLEDDKATPPTSLVDLIRADAERYVTKEEAFQQLSALGPAFADFDLSDDLRGIYIFTANVVRLSEVPSTKLVAEYLSAHKGADAWFVEINRSTEKYMRRVRKDSVTSAVRNFSASITRLAALTSNPDDYTVVEATRPVIVGFRHSSETEIQAFKISAKPQLPNLQAVDCFIIPVLSKTTLLLASNVRWYSARSWEELRMTDTNDWFYGEAAFKKPAEIQALFVRIRDRFRTLVEEPIRARYSEAVVSKAKPSDASASPAPAARARPKT